MYSLSRRWVWRILLSLLILALLGLIAVGLALRYWYVPHASDYRDKITALISDTTGTPITIQSIEGAWEGVRPTLEFKQVAVYDHSNHPALNLDRIYGVLSWWSLLYGSIEFYRLEIDRPTLAMRRDKAGKFFLAGIELPQGDPTEDTDLADWLLQQRSLVVNNATLSWQDAKVSDAVLVLTDLGFRLENRGRLHNFGLTARPPSDIASPLVVQGSVRGRTFSQLRHWSGDIHTELNQVDLKTLRHFLPIPAELRQGSGALKLVFTGDGKGRVGVSADLTLKDVRAQFNPNVAELALAEVTGKVGFKDLAPGFEVTTENLAVKWADTQQPWRPGDAKIVFHPASDKQPERGEITTKQIDLTGLLVVLQSIPLPENARAQLRQFAPAGRLQDFIVGWTSSNAGLSQYQLKGQFQNLSLAAHDELPGFSGLSGGVNANQNGGGLIVDSKAVIYRAPTMFVEPLVFDNLTAQARWKTTKDGVDVTVDNAAFANSDGAMSLAGRYRSVAGTPGWADVSGKLLRGDVRGLWRYVPRIVPDRVRAWMKVSLLAGKSESGSFKLNGNLYDFPFADDKGGIFEFVADAHDGVVRPVPEWPKIEDISARLIFRGITMDIAGNNGRIFQSKIRKGRIRIVDLAHHDPVVEVELQSDSSVQDGLRYIAESDVRKFIRGGTDRFAGSGNSKLDLKLSIPLARLPETRVAGTWQFINGQLTDQQKVIPDLNKITGPLLFSERGIEAKQLQGEVLGGPGQATIATDKNHKITINAKGKATATGVLRQYKNPAAQYFSGAGDWSGVIQVQNGDTSIKIGATGTLLGGPAKLNITNLKDGTLRIDGQGDATLAGMKQHFDPAAMKYVTANANWTAAVTIQDDKGELRATANTSVLGAPAQFQIATTPDGTTTLEGGGSVETAALEKDLKLAILKDFAKTTDWKTKIKLKDGKTGISIDATSKLYGEPIALSLMNRSGDDWDVRAKGSMTPKMIRQISPQPWVDDLSGVGEWSGQFQVRGKKYGGQIESNLRGLTSNLPRPFAKTANESWPSRIDIQNLDAKQERWQIKLADQLNAQLLLREIDYGKRDVPRAEIAFGGPAPALSRDGVWLSGTIASLDADGWRRLSKRMSAGNGASQQNAASIALGGVDLTVANMNLFNRDFVNFQIKAEQGKSQWLIGLDGDNMRGNALWQPDGAGTITARFSQLSLPAENPPAPTQANARPEPSNVGRLPSMDIVADNFQIGKRKLGRLELRANQEGQDWHMERVRLSTPAGVFTADGVWQGWLDRPQTAMNLNLKVTDLGQFLGNMGYPGTVKRGSAEIVGRVSWLGDPYALDPASLSGNFTLAAKSGQFLKVQPGVGKLLGLISLQALPKRITLDFRDIFSDGFAFDAISATVKMDLGEMQTDDFFMRGSSAGVIMQGTADARTESQNLKVKVIPNLAETFAVAGGIAGGPVIGIAAYLLQKILQNPFDKIFAYEYNVTGNWDDPVVAKVSRPQQEKKIIRR